MSNKPLSYITTSRGMAGHFAVLLSYSPEFGGFYEPYETGSGRYKTQAEARQEAELWAAEENIPYQPAKDDPHVMDDRRLVDRMVEALGGPENVTVTDLSEVQS